MFKLFVAITVVLVLLTTVIGLGWLFSHYNEMVKMEEDVTEAWSQVENVYQRRYDLVPTLIAAHKDFLGHQNQIFADLSAARDDAIAVGLTPEILKDPKQLAAFNAVQQKLQSKLMEFKSLAEDNPEIQGQESLLVLMAQIEGSQNRITTEIRRFNKDTKSFNTAIRQIPKTILAGFFGFTPLPYFEAIEGAEVAPSYN